MQFYQFRKYHMEFVAGNLNANVRREYIFRLINGNENLHYIKE
jgi:hypothetical protein